MWRQQKNGVTLKSPVFNTFNTDIGGWKYGTYNFFFVQSLSSSLLEFMCVCVQSESLIWSSHLTQKSTQIASCCHIYLFSCFNFYIISLPIVRQTHWLHSTGEAKKTHLFGGQWTVYNWFVWHISFCHSNNTHFRIMRREKRRLNT